ncbi:MFS transporter [Actinoplanes sp. KI2]|uniref:MFS transporter n=1 Tax=Actinoplanes sp. KI2 TaxID=2983315 RepID=UPI0021D5E586|nr:MFS transporter [Actinoplanes sp. KI2]MCU7725636.1 MFS transporter [Actinoplanes sp. KI2]
MRRNASLFVLISLLSGLGSTAMTLVARVWVLDLTGSVALAALTGLCIYAPTFAAPWLGTLVDRLPRRTLLIAVDVVLGLLILGLLPASSPGAVGLIFAVLVARGLSYVLLDAGESAILPSAVPATSLGDVNGWRSSAQEGMKIVAPLLGAGVYAWRGPIPVVLACAALPLLTATCYALLRLPRTPAAPVAHGAGGRVDWSGRGEVRAGLRALFGNPAVRGPVLVAAAAIGLSGLVNAALIGQVVHGLHLPATRLGVLSTAQGVGSIVSGLLVGRLLARLSPPAVAALGTAIFAAACVCSSIPWWPALIAGGALSGLGLVLALIAGVTAVQTCTPGHLLGRVSATSNTVMFGPVAVAIPLGSALVGFGPTPLFLAAAALAAAAALYRPRSPAVQPSSV